MRARTDVDVDLLLIRVSRAVEEKPSTLPATT
jgi:hypothetical protein